MTAGEDRLAVCQGQKRDCGMVMKREGGRHEGSLRLRRVQTHSGRRGKPLEAGEQGSPALICILKGHSGCPVVIVRWVARVDMGRPSKRLLQLPRQEMMVAQI